MPTKTIERRQSFPEMRQNLCMGWVQPGNGVGRVGGWGGGGGGVSRLGMEEGKDFP